MTLDAKTTTSPDDPMPPAGTPVSLRVISADTVRAITTLKVTPEQASYVAGNAVSIAQAYFDASAWFRAVYAGEVPVGFVMIEDETLLSAPQRPAEPAVGLWRFMIDWRAQGRGFGAEAIALVVAHVLTRPGIRQLWCSVVPGPHSPRRFYEKLGFVATGAVDDGEEVLVLDLAPLGDAAPAPTPPPASSAFAAQPPGEAALVLAKRLIRHIDSVPTQREFRPPLYDSLCARLSSGTAAEQLAVGIDTVAAGQRSCPYHFHHAQEELFIVLEGRGHLRVAGELLPLRAGDLAFIPPGPAYPHQIVNTSDAALKYLSISTTQVPELVEYPDSGKYLAVAGPRGARSISVIQRPGASLDYWDGEP